MDKIASKLLELEEERSSILKCQEMLLKEIKGEVELNTEEYLKVKMMYGKNKEELKQVNQKIEILNNAIDIIEGIGL